MSHPHAVQIAEQLLERTRLEMFGGAFEDFANGFCIPMRVETFDGMRMLNCEADIKAVHDSLQARFTEAGATDLIRHVVAAEFRTDTIIHSTHESRLIRHRTYLQEPMSAFSVLKLGDSGWQVADATYAVTDDDTYARVLTGTD